ncbi:MAG TPA: hypothetical protein PK059_08575 [Cyclobacteriaceae bacterium]|nr:hypothetical protein [Cyclobacteriaceae bacterium]
MASKDSNEEGTNDPVDNSSDNFGLPDLDYKPLDQPAAEASETHTQESVAAPEPTPSHSYETETRSTDMDGVDGLEETKSKSPAILIVAVILVVVAAGYLIYNFVWAPRAEAERLAKEKQAKELALQKKQKEEAEARAKQEAEERRRQQELANAKPVIGTIETLTAPTRRYYVIVTSDIDDDLLMDYAKKLSEKGVSSKIIPPFGGKNFYRLAIADHDSFASAQTNADAVKNDYGNTVWVLRY